MAIAIITGLHALNSTNSKATGRNCTLCKVNLAKANINIWRRTSEAGFSDLNVSAVNRLPMSGAIVT